MYGLFYKDIEGKIYGMTERSFSMGLSSNMVRVFETDKKSKKLFLKSYMAGKMKLNETTTDPQGKEEKVKIVSRFIVRLSSPKCGIEVDLERRNTKMFPYTSSYYARNVPFKVVDTEKYSKD